MKKTLLLVLTVCMIVAMLPVASFAVSEEQGGAEPETQMSLEDEVPDGWLKDETTGKWMYYSEGNPKVGKNYIDGHWYFFDVSGFMQVGFQLVDQKETYCFFDKTTGDPRTTTHGQMHTGWLDYNNSKYYLDLTTGARYTGLKTISGSKYYFADNGKMKTGWIKVDDKRTYYGNLKNGKLKSGWMTLDKKKYYFDTKSCKIKTGWVTIKGAKYYFDKTSGAMKTGWLTLSGHKYYLGTNGKMVTGFKTISKKKYYFKSNGVMVTGLVTIKGYKYYFDSKGVMKTGAVKINSSLYYFFSSGKAVRNNGWFKGSDGKQRYSLGGGKVATGTRKIGTYWYTFSYTTGILLGKQDQADRNIQSISSSTSYLIQVLRRNHQVRVYKGKKGAWDRIYTFTCSVGDKENPTPVGNTFKIMKKVQKHETTHKSGFKVRCWGWCKFFEDSEKEYALNSILYRSSDGSVYDGRLGANCTPGTVRMSYNNAMWIYYNCPVNTRVYIAA